MTELTIVGARVLTEPDEIASVNVTIEGGRIASLGNTAKGRTIDARGLLLLPGIVDLHGDAFERQIMPRPGVHFPLDLALLETDRQLIANGITTAFHGLTWSWEPGLRGREAALTFFESMDRLKSRFIADTRVHLRHEIYNVGAADEILGLLTDGRVGLLAFNDHLPMMRRKSGTPQKLAQYAERASLSLDSYLGLLDEVAKGESAVAPANDRIAAAARAGRIAMASHDDHSPELRRHYHELGCDLCEFPLNRQTIDAAHALGNAVIMGAPNVVRGGSHTNGLKVADMVREHLVDVLTSDYYYPALLQAPFRLAAEGICDFISAWRLVSKNPALRAGLQDRGSIAPGKRADLVLVDDHDPLLPQVVGTLVSGRVASTLGGHFA